MVRYVGNYYEKELERKNEQLVEEVLNLSSLNADLSIYKSKINLKIEEENKLQKNNDGDIKIKNRILTYLKDKLISIDVGSIAFIHTEHSITVITCLDGQRYNSNSSLDELYNSLDSTMFFRANRQYILSVKGIDEILKYGNNQLKINTDPSIESGIIISKNKASEFKRWLNM
jgi:DNA-binding LytR/AlgR family response regulator